MIHKRFTGDSENDLKINIFLKVGESDVDLDLDADSDADTDVVFKDPAQVSTFKGYSPIGLDLLQGLEMKKPQNKGRLGLCASID